MDLPAWYPFPSEEAKPAPMPLLIVQGFLNTWYFGDAADLLGNVDSAANWLEQAGMLEPGDALGPSDLEQVRAVREVLRSLVAVDAGALDPSALAPLRELAATHPVYLEISTQGRIALESRPPKRLLDHLVELLLIIRNAQEDRTWSRLRICANSECRWVFYDRSRNQQGNWCDMAGCGNREKNRRLRARRRE